MGFDGIKIILSFLAISLGEELASLAPDAQYSPGRLHVRAELSAEVVVGAQLGAQRERGALATPSRGPDGGRWGRQDRGGGGWRAEEVVTPCLQEPARLPQLLGRWGSAPQGCPGRSSASRTARETGHTCTLWSKGCLLLPSTLPSNHGNSSCSVTKGDPELTDKPWGLRMSLDHSSLKHEREEYVCACDYGSMREVTHSSLTEIPGPQMPPLCNF